MERWEPARLSTAERGSLDNATEAVCEILRSTPPGVAHSALTRAIALLREAGESTREVERSDLVLVGEAGVQNPVSVGPI